MDDKQRRAKHGWFNWYVNRGRMPLGTASDQELKRAARQVSWRRTF